MGERRCCWATSLQLAWRVEVSLAGGCVSRGRYPTVSAVLHRTLSGHTRVRVDRDIPDSWRAGWDWSLVPHYVRCSANKFYVRFTPVIPHHVRCSRKPLDVRYLRVTSTRAGDITRHCFAPVPHHVRSNTSPNEYTMQWKKDIATPPCPQKSAPGRPPLTDPSVSGVIHTENPHIPRIRGCVCHSNSRSGVVGERECYAGSSMSISTSASAWSTTESWMPTSSTVSDMASRTCLTSMSRVYSR